MYNVKVRNIGHPNVVLGMALGYGGLVQLIAGVEEWACGNVSTASASGSGPPASVLYANDVDLWCDCLLVVRRLLVLVRGAVHPSIQHRW
jgi:hypothetical protein